MTLYRQATRSELDLAVEWAAREGWNPGLVDADIFWATDPDGFVCAEREGEVIATGSIVSYGSEFGFMGFFIVRPDLRSRGIGREFWHWRRDTLRSRLSDDAAIGMDGVFDMQDFYAKGGFSFAQRNLRMEGIGQPTNDLLGLTPLTDVPIEAVLAYDELHFGFARRAFIESWIRIAGGVALGAYDGQRLSGMGVMRPCRNGFKIGPLFSNDAETADRLFRGLSSHAADRPIFLDIPENNPNAVELARRHRLSEVFGCARMYHGPAPQLPWDQIYGISTFELG